jgi:mannose-6-phosphate isomerase-like protein (cupin superfamily)
MTQKVRRVVTGHDRRGAATIISDGDVPFIHTIPQRPGWEAHEIWATSEMPAPIEQAGEPTDRPRSIHPSTNGTVCRVVTFPPEHTFIHKIDRAAAQASFAAAGSPQASVGMENSPHPLMHRTETVDYGIVLSGEIYLVLEATETLLKAGDVVVQRGTNHAWSNRSLTEPCRMAFILIDGKRDGGART